MKKRLLSIILILITLFSIVSNVAFAGDYSIITVVTYSNLYGYEEDKQMMVSDEQLYISPEDAAYFSNSELVSSNSKLQFITSGTVTEIDSGQVIRNTGGEWLPIESTLQKLDTNCIEENGILFFYCNNRKEDLYSFTKMFMNKSTYKINFLDGFAGNTGVVLSQVLDVALNMRFLEVLANKYDANNYRDIAIDLIRLDTQDENIISATADMNTALKNASTDYGIAAGVLDAILSKKELAEVYFGSGYGSYVEEFLGEYGKIASNLKTGEVLKGMDYAYSVSNACGLFADSISSTILKYKDYYGKNKDLNRAFSSVISDYNRQAGSSVYFRSITEEVLTGLANEGTASLLGMSSKVIGIEKRILDIVFKNSDKTEGVINAELLKQVQNEATAIYNECDRSGDFVGMKYAAILYLRAGQKAYQGFDFDKELKSGSKKMLDTMGNLIARLAAFDDNSLTRAVSNSRIAAKALVSTPATSDIYDVFLETREWAWTDAMTGEPYSLSNSLIITSKKIFDFDGDGTLELWFEAVNQEALGPRGPETLTCFYTIIGGKPERLLSGYISGGTIGGETVVIGYNKATLEHVVGLHGYAGGFGGHAVWEDYYSMNNGRLNKIDEFSMISQIEYNYSEDQLKDSSLYYEDDYNPFENGRNITIYEVNGKQARKEAYDEKAEMYIEPINDMYRLN